MQFTECVLCLFLGNVLLFASSLASGHAFLGRTSRREMLRMSSNQKGMRNVCVVGGGFGGLYTALKIEKGLQPADKVKITLIDPKV